MSTLSCPGMQGRCCSYLPASEFWRQSTISLEGERVVALPGGTARGADLVGPVALHAQAAVVLASAGEAAQLSVLVHWVHDPVEPGVLHQSCQKHQRCAILLQSNSKVVKRLESATCSIWLQMCAAVEAEMHEPKASTASAVLSFLKHFVQKLVLSATIAPRVERKAEPAEEPAESQSGFG